MLKHILLKLINYYQQTLSPDHSVLGKAHYPYGFCKYYPSCSQYAKEAIERRGIIAGMVVAIWRIMRCNPLSKGGFDPVKIPGF